MTSQNFLDELAKDPFVDLTIECEAHIFRAHRIMVSRKSEVLKRAFVGNFIEAKNRELKLSEDDVQTVKRMLIFCYTDDYDDGSGSANQVDCHSLVDAMSQNLLETDPASSTAIEEQGQLGQDTDTTLANDSLGEDDTQERAAEDLVWEGLVNNALVYAIADKYAIHLLKALAREKFKALIKEGLPCNFSRIVHEVFNSTPANDRGLRDLVIDKCMIHLDVLLQEEAFGTLLHKEVELGCVLLHRENEKRNELSRYVTDIVESYEMQIDAQSRELESARCRRDNLLLLLDDREKILANTSGCRHCGASFDCVFRTGESLLRCAKCRTNHSL